MGTEFRIQAIDKSSVAAGSYHAERYLLYWSRRRRKQSLLAATDLKDTLSFGPRDQKLTDRRSHEIAMRLHGVNNLSDCAKRILALSAPTPAFSSEWRLAICGGIVRDDVSVDKMVTKRPRCAASADLGLASISWQYEFRVGRRIVLVLITTMISV